MGDFTKEEQNALDQLQKICDSHHSKTTETLQKCALLKLNQQQRAKLAAEEDARKKADELQAAALRLEGQRRDAATFVGQQIHALQAAGLLINGALWKATTDYDAILAARAREPIVVDIILNLAIEMLPELKLAGRAMKGFELAGPRVRSKGWKAMADLADALGNARPPKHIVAVPAKVRTFGEFLDRRSNDILAAIRNPVVANSDIDAATTERMQAYQAKNQILTGVLGQLHRKLVIASFMEGILYKFISWYDGENVLTIVKQAFGLAGLDGSPFDGDLSSFEALADILLYDMLQAYVTSYFVVYSLDGWTFDDLPEDGGGHAVMHGLDRAQVQMICDRCKTMKIPNHTGRMPVYGFKDFVKRWGARFEVTNAMGVGGA